MNSFALLIAAFATACLAHAFFAPTLAAEVIPVQPASLWTATNPAPISGLCNPGNPQVTGLSDVATPTPSGGGVRSDVAGITFSCCECAYAERTFQLGSLHGSQAATLSFYYETALSGDYAATDLEVSFLQGVSVVGSRALRGLIGISGADGCDSPAQSATSGQVVTLYLQSILGITSFDSIVIRLNHYGCVTTGYQVISDLTLDIDPGADSDGDGVSDVNDNCPNAANPGQEDLDVDAMGDLCDTDTVVTASPSFGTPRTFLGLRVASGGVLTADAAVTVTGNMTIESGGSVTHTRRLLAGLVLNVAGTLDVQAGGAIDADVKGLLGGFNGSVFGVRGETFDAAGNIVPGAGREIYGGGGGSYGGYGAGLPGYPPTAWPPYGLAENPNQLGSGAGGIWGFYSPPGSHGGGRIHVMAGVLTLNGIIRANGGAALDIFGNFGSSGSGGAVRLDVGSLSGSGAIEANGGGGPALAGGGGGRIAVYYTTLSFPGANLSARGYGNPSGTAGTIYLKDTAAPAGDFIVDNGGQSAADDTPLRTGLTTLSSLTIRNSARLGVTSADIIYLTVAQPIVLASAGTLTVGDGVTLAITNGSGYDIQTPTGTTLNLSQGSALSADRLQVNGGTLNSSTILGFSGANDFDLSGGGIANILGSAVLSIPSFGITNFRSGTLKIDTPARLDIGANSATVGAGVTLVKDGAFGLLDQIGSMTIQSGGLVTHSGRNLSGLALDVTGLLQVESGGVIDVSGNGLRGGNNGSVFYCDGEGFDAAGNIVGFGGGPAHGTGGSHGGLGGLGQTPTNGAYGLIETPDKLGSGGGGGCNYGNRGAAGGGRVAITAENIEINGAVRANGATADGRGGGSGSGGAIVMRTLAASGALSGNGTIEANGGEQTGYYGGGGGGRVALYYGSLTIPTSNIAARGGYSTYWGGTDGGGGAGTMYLKGLAENYGDLIIDNGVAAPVVFKTPLRTALSGFRNVIIQKGGKLSVESSVVPHLVVANLSIDGTGSVLSHPARDLAGLRVSVSGALALSNGGSVEANAAGLLGAGQSGNTFGDAGETFGPDGTSVVSGSTAGSGASYGGLGGGAGRNPTYGIPESPSNTGSGGARSTGSGLGGRAGGRIWIEAVTCDIPTGTIIRANGEPASPGAGDQGGGSGGGIKLDCLTVTGGGSLQAVAGAGAGTNGHGGGGGRIALRTNNNSFTGSITPTVATAGGAATGSGQAGAMGTFFVGDLVAPRVTTMSPAPGSTVFSKLNQIVITFTENLYPPSIAPNIPTVTGAATGLHYLTGQSSFTNDGIWTFNLSNPLPQDAYTLTLISGEGPAGLSDTSLNALDGECPGGVGPQCEAGELGGGNESGDGVAGGNFVVSFVVNEPPYVTSVIPTTNSLDVPESSNISLIFSEALNPATVTNSTLRLLKDGLPVLGTVSLATSGLRVSIDPMAELELGSVYTIEVTTGVQDLTGQPAVPFSSQFRTVTLASGNRTLPSAGDPAPGLAALAKTGHRVAPAGDLNGDGRKDFLAGAPGYQPVSGPVEAGAAVIYFGSTDSAERKSADIIFTGASAHDRVGSAIAGRFDFNEDGFPDILVGAEQVNRTPDNDPGAGCNAGQPCGPGKVYLIYFNPADTTHYPSIGNPSVPDFVSLALVGQPGGIPGVVFTGVSVGDLAGYAVAGGGRVKGGSTRPAIAIGAPKRTVMRPLAPPPSARGPVLQDTTVTEAGVAYVIFGDPTLSGTIDLSRVANGQPDEVAGVVYEGGAAGDLFGFSVTFPGDVMGTVGDDVAIGAPYADPVVNSTTLGDAGIAYVIQGGALTTGTVNVNDVGTLVDGTQIVGTQAGMLTGWSLAGGGDNQVDGAADLLIGAPLYSAALLTSDGLVAQTSVKIVKGTTQIDVVGGIPGTCTLAGVRWLGAASGDQLGYSVTGLGDVTGDGYDDIALGAPLADPVVGGSPVSDAGIVYLIDGAPVADPCRGELDVSLVGSTVAGVPLVGTTPNEQAGTSLAGTGDLSGDGYDDFVVGAPLKDVGGDPDAGTVYEVLDAHVVPPVTCSSSGFEVADLGEGTSATFTSGALSCPLTVAVSGTTEQGLLGAAPPAGSGLAGAIELGPAGVVVGGAGAHVVVGLHPLYASLSPSALRLYRLNGSAWTDTGLDALIGPSPFYPGRLAAQADLPAGSVLGLYAVFVADSDGDGIANYLDNCPLVSNTPQTDGDGDGVGDVCDNCPAAYNLGQQNADGDAFGDACDVCPNDSNNDADNDGYCNGPTFNAPKTGANDNCPLIPNPSQADADSDGVGDACEGVCNVTVDDSGGADFGLVQDAVGHLVSLGLASCQVRVKDGIYAEHLALTAPVEIVGVGPGTPVVDAGGSGAVVTISNPASGAVILRNLDLRGGATGLTTTRQVDLYNVSITQVVSGGVGLEVLAQTTTMRGGRIEVNGGAGSTGVRVAGTTTGAQAARVVLGDGIAGTVYRSPIAVLVPGGTGVDVAAGKSADLTGVEVRTAATGLQAAGVVTLTSALIADGTTGIAITAATGAQVTVDYVTLANLTTGIDNANAAGSSLTLRHSLAHGNGADLGGTATCPQVFASDTATPDCTAGGNPNGNLNLTPLYVDAGNGDPLLRDYHLAALSVVPDNGTAGVRPSLFTGPCRDLSGNPRLRDANGDGLAVTDLGAYEMGRLVAGPGEVPGVVFQSKTTLAWSPEPSAATYCIYRGTGGSGGTPLGVCLDLTPLQCGTSTTTLTDAQDPPIGGFFHYLIQAVDGAATPGTLGNGTCNERTPVSVCQ